MGPSFEASSKSFRRYFGSDLNGLACNVYCSAVVVGSGIVVIDVVAIFVLH